MFKAGRVQAVVGEAEKMSAGGKHAAEVDRKLQYFRDSFDRMKYDEYILNGWFIDSGVVESACKCVVQQRLDLSGMHWSLKGAAANNTKVAKKELRGTPYDILSNHAASRPKPQPSKGSIPAIS